MRRRTLLVVLSGLAVVGAAGAIVLWPAGTLQSKITPENCARIQVGMTRAEVEAILGPPRDYTTMMPIAQSYSTGNIESTTAALINNDITLRREVWAADGLAKVICFSSDGKVTVLATCQWRCDERAPFTNIYYRAKRQWHRWFPE
jgi:hypothetical protein